MEVLVSLILIALMGKAKVATHFRDTKVDQLEVVNVALARFVKEVLCLDVCERVRGGKRGEVIG